MGKVSFFPTSITLALAKSPDPPHRVVALASRYAVVSLRSVEMINAYTFDCWVVCAEHPNGCGVPF